MFAIACGYEDADDCDALRTDPLFKLAVGRAPESGRALCSQPTMSRLENAPSRLEVARMTAALVDLFCRSFDAPPVAITFLRLTAGRSNGSRVSSVMVGVALSLLAKELALTTNFYTITTAYATFSTTSSGPR